MITVRMIQYWNDYHKKELRENCKDLKELGDWIFNQMRVDYSSEHGKRLLSFPKCDTERGIYEISVMPEYGGCVFWIKQIEDDRSGILFSDGTFTAGQKHCTKMVREWLVECERRKKNPTFNFAPDEAGKDGDSREDIAQGRVGESCMDRYGKDDMISGQIIRKAAKRIYDIGGCDARDGYGRGYDAAIETAVDILLEETGYTLEDILYYEEDEES